ncbi:MAG: hypothetical protein PHO10_08270 [Gemmiger sp.]|nr:hypothetical protein [Gemmiger sp.]
MLDILRMDLRRLARGKHLFVYLAVIAGVMALVIFALRLVSDSETLAAMAAQGGEVTAEDEAEALSILAMSHLDVLVETLANGFFLVAVGFGTGLFIVADFTSGYAKNIFSISGHRWRYVAAKAVSCLVISALSILTLMATTLLFARVLGLPLKADPLVDWLQYAALQSLVGWAFGMLMLLCAVLARKDGWMVGAAFLFGTGAIPMAVGWLCNTLLGFTPISYSLFWLELACPPHFTPASIPFIGLVSLAWVAIYGVLATLALQHSDI